MDAGSIHAPRRGRIGVTTGVALRASSTDDVVAAVSDAIARRGALRIVGRGRWLDAGRPTRDAMPLELDDLSGITAYVPGDLTLTARAGTPLSAIADAAAPHGQWLALDPFGGDGSLGATVATASAGPLAHAFGTPRDMTLGIEAVTGLGTVIRAGGRVVKNVAGFDLTRLFTGAWGTLGVITEITVRLRARPEVEETWCLPVPDGALAGVSDALRAAPIVPIALELVDARAAGILSLGNDDAVLVRLAGNDSAIRAQRTALAALGDAVEVPPTVWGALRAAEPAAAAVARLSARPHDVATLWSDTRDIVARSDAAWRHASLGRGIVRIVVPAPDGAAVDALAAAAAACPTSVIERLPARAWAAAAPPVPNAELARRVKRAFDPHDVLNPGILGLDP